VLLPNGNLYAFNALDAGSTNLDYTLSGAPVAELSAFGDVYSDPALLSGATTPPTVTTTFTNQSSGGTLQIGWSTTYSGVIMVTVYVGANETQRTFLVTV